MQLFLFIIMLLSFAFFRLHNVLGLYTACGFNVLLVEYRGYGRSEGSPSEQGETINLSERVH